MSFTTRPTLQGTFGMVSTTHWIASATAMAVLETGGNAFDAAVAAGFVLHLAEPHLNGPGGDMPALIAVAGQPGIRVLCGQGPAPAAATVQAYAALGLAEIPGSGPLAAAVPGAVDAWLVLLRDHGTKPLAEVLSYAIGYAEHGIPLVAAVGDTVRAARDRIERDWPTSARFWLPDGRPPAPGERWTYPEYARVLAALAGAAAAGGVSREEGVERARAVWGQGMVAQALDEFAAHPVRHADAEHPYLVSGADLAAYRASWEEPVTVDVFGHTVAKTGPWGQGPALLLALHTLQALGDPDALDPGTETGAHAAVEALKLAMADREAWFGDSLPVPLEDLLSVDYAGARARLIGDRADVGLRPGNPGGRPARIDLRDRRGSEGDDGTTGEPTVDAPGRTRGDTCHLDVVDRWGNMISATPSGGWLQSSPVIPGLGFPLGCRLQMCRLEPDLPTSLIPGRRPRTTLTPTMVLRDGVPWMACGSPGGDQQDQWQLLFLLRTLVGRQELQVAIDAPAFHTLSFPGPFWPHTTEPGVVVAEDRLAEATLTGLRRRGHLVRTSGPWSLGRLCAVTRDAATGRLQAAANPRGMQGYAIGR